MLPLAILSGLLVGTGLPAVYSYGLSVELLNEANVLAKQLSGRLGDLVAERPRLWAYDVDRLDAVVRPLSETLKGAQVSIQTAREPNAYRLGQGPKRGGVTGWAVVNICIPGWACIGLGVNDYDPVKLDESAVSWWW